MKAVGALVYFKLRSQTLSVCSKSTPTVLQVSFSDGMVTYVKVSGAKQATKEKTCITLLYFD